jgi:hypothetical protein
VTPTPNRPKLYHITHVNYLPSIIADGMLLSDALLIARQGASSGIGISKIKERRLTMPISCHPALHVGECVPFYFCPRSIMLFVIHCKNHPDLAFKGGQEPIVHLEADLYDVVGWANKNGRRWAFSTSNAGAFYTPYFADLTDLGQLDWGAIAATDFRSPAIKEKKQAEFLLEESFPWTLVSAVGVHSTSIKVQADAAMSKTTHKPSVTLQPSWYY